MEKPKLRYSIADVEAFHKQFAADSARYKQLIDQMGPKTNSDVQQRRFRYASTPTSTCHCSQRRRADHR